MQLDKLTHQYQGLTKADANVTYTLKESMNILDHYLKSKPHSIKLKQKSGYLPCKLPDDLMQIYHWRNGIRHLSPNIELYPYSMLEYIRKQKNLDDNLIQIASDSAVWLFYDCNQGEGIYYDDYYGDSLQKKYYDFNHMLHIMAQVYQRNAHYYNEYGEWYTDKKILAQIERENLSSVDKLRYEKLINLLSSKAIEYQDALFFRPKRSLIMKIGETYDKRLINVLLPYLKDWNERVVSITFYALGNIGTKETLPILFDYINSNHDKKYREMALHSISKIVDRSDTQVVEKIYPLLTHEELSIRLYAYRVIDKVSTPSSIPYLKKVFPSEKRAAKFLIINIFSKIGGGDTLPLLQEYLNEVNQMDSTQEDEGTFRGHNYPPHLMERVLLKAIKAIQKREDL